MIRSILRLVLSLAYFIAGIIHLVTPRPFLTIMPGWVPAPEAVVLATGMAEILGAIGLAQGISAPLRKAAAIELALYAVCVFPANINHFMQDMAKPGNGLGLVYHVPRMFAQPLVVWLALWTGQVLDWPFNKKTR